MKIPEDLKEFLYWVKDRTEALWATEPPYECGIIHKSFSGAKWIGGLTSRDIDKIENEFKLKFPPDIRLFLEILHTIDRQEVIESYDEETNEVESYERPFFYNWREQQAEIQERLNWPYNTILEDILGVNPFWLKAWGIRPQNEKECENIFSSWYKKAPKLIPITGHRFIISEPNTLGNPVLSVWGSDIILYGWNLREYLLNELKWHLGINNESGDLIHEFKEIKDKERKIGKMKSIPYWEDMILSCNFGWDILGRECPYPYDGPGAIVKAETIGDETQHKLFQDFD